MKKDRTPRLVMAAVFAALTCVATMVINIPIPATKGYLNLGDCMVLLGAFFLGPYYGAASGALGSALSDLLLGYAYYAPGTAVIKGLMALMAALLFALLKHRSKLAYLLAAFVSEFWMVLGYFLYESTVLGYGLAAVESVPANLIQAIGGALIGVMLYRVLITMPQLKQFQSKEG